MTDPKPESRASRTSLYILILGLAALALIALVDSGLTRRPPAQARVPRL